MIRFRSFKIKKLIYTLFFLLLITLILTNAPKSTYYALQGLNLWFSRMIPSLLPFMIISGIMVRLQLTESFVSVIHPLLAPVWRVQKNVTYAMVMGFLCGFPMGARVTCDLLKRNQITQMEAEFLLAFCNNIGPVYFTGFVLPLLNRKLLFPYLFGMYGLPFLYGLFLRYTVYKKLSSNGPKIQNQTQTNHFSLLEQIDDAITTSIQGILSLGGYMILFNLLNLIPVCLLDFMQHIPAFQVLTADNSLFFKELPSLFAPILEITGGLFMFGDRMPLYSLLLLPFGGLCCIAQTYSIIRNSGLSIHSYVYHKLILAGITSLYYLGWNILFPGNFLS